MSSSIPSPDDRFHPVTAETAFAASPVPQALLDGAWQVVRANGAWREATGGDPAGASWMDLVHADDLARDLPAIGRMQAGDLPSFRTALRLAAADGGWTSVRLEATSLGAEGVLATLLPAAAEPSSPAGASSDRRILASAMSHDVRQHARLVSAYASLLARSQLTDKQRAHLATVSDHADRLQHILAELVRWLRLPDEPIENAAADVGALWAAATAGREADFSHGELPTVSGDPDLLAMLFSALVDNAVRYREGRARVDLSARRLDGAWEFIVSDDGPGIPADQRERVLLPLNRLHTWEQATGHGMGLALASRIAVRHGGGLRIDAAAGGGCAVHVRLPG